jgi:hypothetical protein
LGEEIDNGSGVSAVDDEEAHPVLFGRVLDPFNLRQVALVPGGKELPASVRAVVPRCVVDVPRQLKERRKAVVCVAEVGEIVGGMRDIWHGAVGTGRLGTTEVVIGNGPAVTVQSRLNAIDKPVIAVDHVRGVVNPYMPTINKRFGITERV